MEKADPVGEGQPRPAHGLILAGKVSGWKSEVLRRTEAADNLRPTRKRRWRAHSKTCRLRGGRLGREASWSAEDQNKLLDGRLRVGSSALGRNGRRSPAIAFLGQDEEQDGAGVRAKTAFPDKRTQALDAPRVIQISHKQQLTHQKDLRSRKQHNEKRTQASKERAET
jgi:hypothetical protein